MTPPPPRRSRRAGRAVLPAGRSGGPRRRAGRAARRTSALPRSAWPRAAHPARGRTAPGPGPGPRGRRTACPEAGSRCWNRAARCPPPGSPPPRAPWPAWSCPRRSGRRARSCRPRRSGNSRPPAAAARQHATPGRSRRSPGNTPNEGSGKRRHGREPMIDGTRRAAIAARPQTPAQAAPYPATPRAARRARLGRHRGRDRRCKPLPARRDSATCARTRSHPA